MIQKLPTAAIAVQPAMLIHECEIQSFCTYDNGQLCTMMHIHHAFYRLVQSFELDERSTVMQVVIQQKRWGHQPIVTVSESSYRVWIDARDLSVELPKTA